MDTLDNKLTRSEIFLHQGEPVFLKSHNYVLPVEVIGSSLLGKLERHEELNLQVLTILFKYHQKYMDDHKYFSEIYEGIKHGLISMEIVPWIIKT